MLRGRVAKKDNSICTLCQYRLSLRRPAPPPPPHRRPFSATAPCPDDSSQTNPLLRIRNPYAPQQPADGSAASSQPSTGPAPPSGIRPVAFASPRRSSNDILDPHEARARQRLVNANDINKPTPPTNLPIEDHLRSQPGARLGDTSRLRRQLPHSSRVPSLAVGHVDLGAEFPVRKQIDRGSLADRAPLQSDRFHRRTGFIGRDPPPRRDWVDRFAGVRKMPGPEWPPTAPPPPSQRPALGGDTPPPRNPVSSPGLSGIARSGVFSRQEQISRFEKAFAGDPPAKDSPRPEARARDAAAPAPTPAPAPSPSSLLGFEALEAAGTRDAEIKTPTKRFSINTTREWDFPVRGTPTPQARARDATAPTPTPAPTPAPASAPSSSRGFEALESAGARDAEIKASTKRLVADDWGFHKADSQEWGQLARNPKPPSFPIENRRTATRDDFNATRRPSNSERDQRSDAFDNSFNSSPGFRSRDDQPSRTESYDASRKSSHPSSSSDTRDLGYDRDTGRRREEAPAQSQRSGGKRKSDRGSRFEMEDEKDGPAPAYDKMLEKRRDRDMRKAQREAERTEPIPIILPELINITSFAKALKIKPDDFLVQLGELGFEGVTLDSLMAGETAALVAQEYGYEPTVDNASHDLKPRPPPEDVSSLPARPPVVTIMGHVDHGKTTILDYLRKSSVAAQEHGGITQHIGAFSVKLSSGKPITFLDTPGHAAFLTMRQRGANVTDIVVLVVAADDSVKPQTLEAIKHAHAAKVPIIVAINKIDKDGARIDAVKADLSSSGVEIEDFGGDVQVVCVSGKTGQGMDDLEENILTLSEILDHRAELDGQAEGWVLESSLKATGKVATVLVKRGTLRLGDYIAAGRTWAKIRELRNEAGVDIEEAPPGTPVEISGWRDLPAAGDMMLQSPDEDKAKAAVSYREKLYDREKDAVEYETINESRKAMFEKRARERAEAEEKTSKNRHGRDKERAGLASNTGVQEILPDEVDGAKMVNFVVKGDVHGSVEAVTAAIQEIGSHEVRPRVLRSGTGAVSEFDVEHAALSNSIIVDFATETPGHIKSMAETQGVTVLEHTIIYRLVDDIKANLSKHLKPDISIKVLGEAEVLQIFEINVKRRQYKNIAGCRVRNGVVGKSDLYKVLRKGEILYTGKLETLKHVKKDVTEMRKGSECGMSFEDFTDMQVGDQIQAYEEVSTARSLS
ncbi:hypothetical protein F4808DRAFT_404697 [Astrocystis sublimbata]|nr:hypothetical protein F4808DRAFT_404697 [Astrocystis sublimbata]